MNKTELIYKYPAIFKEDSLVFDVPQEWITTLDELCDALQNCHWAIFDPSYEGAMSSGQVVAEHVEEESGELRFYYHIEYDRPDVPPELRKSNYGFVNGIIAYAESLGLNWL